MADSYALGIDVNGTNTSASYNVEPTSGFQFTQGGVSVLPTAMDAAMVSIYPEELSIHAPAGQITGGVMIQTSASQIVGRVLVSPPINVGVVITLFGAGGQQLAQVALYPPTDDVFTFTVSGTQAIGAHEADSVLRRLVRPATP